MQLFLGANRHRQEKIQGMISQKLDDILTMTVGASIFIDLTGGGIEKLKLLIFALIGKKKQTFNVSFQLRIKIMFCLTYWQSRI